ncbi:MAG: hypothetical protein AAF702_52030 [Chloroflexota bacterium]
MNPIWTRLVRSLIVVLILMFGWSVTAPALQRLEANIAPVQQTDLTVVRIYAYRNWQSVGLRLKKDEIVRIVAEGSWLYTPGDYHGPEGHPRFLAPTFYPFHGPGGALIGRIGDTGDPFYIGEERRVAATQPGILYFRINDDILSDNDGYVAVEVAVTEPVR